MRLLFGANADVTYCEVYDSDTKIQKFFNSEDWKIFDGIYITDIPINKETVDLIDAVQHEDPLLVVRHFDHHKTALYMNDYSWAQTVVKDELGLCSGTYLFYKYMAETTNIETMYSTTKDFVELIRRWDTWEWKDIYNDLEAKKLNDLLHVYGPYRFENILVETLKACEPPINETSSFVIQLEEERNNKFMAGKAKEIVRRKFKGYTLGIVYSDRCISELGNLICEQNPDVDIAVLIDPSCSLSFRTMKNIDCTEIALLYGGGGHKFAAGCPVPKGLSDLIIDTIFKE